MNYFHACIHAHTPHHVHILLHTILSFFFFFNCSTHMRVYFHHCLHACSCIHSMFSVHTITNISASSTTTDRLMFHYCSHASIHAHTHHHVHKSLYTLLFFFYDKLVVLMCISTLDIACMYSLHACSCIHSMFSMHACSCFTPCFQCIQSPTYVHRLRQPQTCQT